MVAQARISALQISSRSTLPPRAGAQPRDLVLKNAEPFVVVATSKGVDIHPARFVGTGTTIDAQGRFAFNTRNAWDLGVKGTVNLATLQIFNPNLLGSGNSIIDASIRGPATEPQVEGRLELKNASLYMADLPNGLDQANGVILFDRNRATVDSLSATTGGGQVTIQKGSFIGFRGPALLYRVQGAADHVRYRSPEGVSITVNSLLNLIGTSDNSVLSGTVTVVRAGFNPTTDVGSLLANTARPVSAPSVPSEYLRGVQFDVRVESAQSLEMQTSLTRNIEAEANLRVRGTPERPSILGNLSINEGEIEFFGNRYRINRGEVNFYNPGKIEPIIDMDLETAVRGITVDITFSGPLSKLNFSYRSDPPLADQRHYRSSGSGANAGDQRGDCGQSGREQHQLSLRRNQCVALPSDQRSGRGPPAALLRRESYQDRSATYRCNFGAASAAYIRAADLKRYHANLHDKSDADAGTDHPRGVGFESPMVRDCSPR